MLRSQVERRPLEEVEAVAELAEISAARELVRRVQVHDEILAYSVALAEATRAHPEVSLGVSPRGALSLVRAAQARAATRGRDFVGPEDLKELASDVLPHRVSLRGGVSGADSRSVVREILDAVSPPD